jgi:hypothetical protein
MVMKKSSMINGSVDGGGGNDDDPPPRPPLPLPLLVGVRDVEAMAIDQVYVNKEERDRNEEERGRTY